MPSSAGGSSVKVGEDLYYPPDRLEALMGRLATAMEAAGQLTLAEARDLLGTSRRYAQALLEHMDSEGMTLRVGDARRLRRRRTSRRLHWPSPRPAGRGADRAARCG